MLIQNCGFNPAETKCTCCKSLSIIVSHLYCQVYVWVGRNDSVPLSQIESRSSSSEVYVIFFCFLRFFFKMLVKSSNFLENDLTAVAEISQVIVKLFPYCNTFLNTLCSNIAAQKREKKKKLVINKKR